MKNQDPQKPKCRVNWNKPTRAGTVCNYVDEATNECNQTDWKHCPCGGIVRSPRFEGLPAYPKGKYDASIRNATLDQLHKLILQDKCFAKDPTKPCEFQYDCVGCAIKFLRKGEP